MANDGVTDYQQLGTQLDQAAEALKGSRRRVRRAQPDLVPPMHAEAAEAPEAAPEAQEAPETQEASHAAADPDSATLTAETLPDGVIAPEEAAQAELFGGSAKPGKPAIDLPALEALLFSTRHPLTTQRLGELIDVPSAKALRAAIADLNRQYELGHRSFRVEQVAGGYQLLTLPAFGPLLNKLHQREIDSKLSRSALETLSIIAYKQPVLRAEVEAIRGVASGETIRSLMEKHLVKIAGRAEEPGRPILYGTTKRFLELFGLNSLKELPKEDQARPPRPFHAPSPPTPSTPPPTATETPTEETPSPS